MTTASLIRNSIGLALLYFVIIGVQSDAGFNILRWSLSTFLWFFLLWGFLMACLVPEWWKRRKRGQ